MFNESLNNSRQTNFLKNEYFDNIQSLDLFFDKSIIANLRALLYKRISKDEQIYLRYNVINSVTNDVFLKDSANVNTFYFIDFRDPFEDSLDVFINKYVQDMEPVDEITEFFKGFIKCRIFITRETKTCVCIISEISLTKFHLLQVALPKMLPWFFETNPLTQGELEMLSALGGDDFADYLKKLNALFDYNFAKLKMLHKSSDEIFTRVRDAKIKNCEDSIRSFFNTVNDLKWQLSDAYKHINETNIVLSALKSVPDNENIARDFISFVSNNKDIVEYDYDDGVISLNINGYIDVFDVDMYETISSNDDSWLWNHVFWGNRNDFKKLADSIFSDHPKYKIRTSSIFRLNIDENEVRVSYRNSDENMTKNPHLGYHHCLGQYEEKIIEALGTNDLIGAISICISSLHSVNVTESITFGELIEDLGESQEARFLEGEDGDFYTPREAFEKLVKEENENA